MMSRVVSTIVFGGAVVALLWFGGQLPERVASHFDVAGHPDGFMPRSLFVLLFSLITAGVPQFIRWWLVREARDTARSRRTAVAARLEFERAVAVRADAIAVATCLFLVYLFLLVVRAHLYSSESPRLDMSALAIGLTIFLLFCAGWYANFLRTNKAFDRLI